MFVGPSPRRDWALTEVPAEESPQPRPFRRRLVINTFATGAGNGWAMVVSLVTLPILVHGLGVAAFGLWVVLQTFSAITGWFSLADLGVGVATTRSVATQASTEDTNNVAMTISTGLSVFAAMGLLWATLFGLIAPWVLPRLFHAPPALVREFRLAIVLFAAQLFSDLVTEGAEACLEGLQRVDLSRAVDAARRSVVAVAVSVAALVTGSLVSVAAASLVASLAGTIIGLTLLWNHTPRQGRHPRWDEGLALLRQGRTVAVIRPLGVIQRTMDRVIVGVILGPSAVAVVEVATQVLNGADAVLSASSYAVFPSASWLHAREDKAMLRRLFAIGTKYSVFATWCICALLIGVADPFVRVWVGPRFFLAPELIVVALIGEMIAAPGQVGSQLLLGAGRAPAILRAAGVALLVNLLASVVLVETVGTVGTFIGTLISNVVLMPFLLGPVLGLVEVHPVEFARRALLPDLAPVVAILLGALVGVATQDRPLAQLIAGVAVGSVAGLAAAAVTTLNKKERIELRSTLRWRS